jgi:hypothetical protein
VDTDTLVTFTSDLSSLTNGKQMFMGCHNLTNFDADLSSLENGDGMFYACPIISFENNLPLLKSAIEMF